jgi:hypothetical protein
MNQHSPKDFRRAQPTTVIRRKIRGRPVNTRECPWLRIKHVCREISAAEAADYEERRARKIEATEGAKLEQLVFERKYARAVVRIERVIRRGFSALDLLAQFVTASARICTRRAGPHCSSARMK